MSSQSMKESSAKCCKTPPGNSSQPASLDAVFAEMTKVENRLKQAVFKKSFRLSKHITNENISSKPPPQPTGHDAVLADLCKIEFMLKQVAVDTAPRSPEVIHIITPDDWLDNTLDRELIELIDNLEKEEEESEKTFRVPLEWLGAEAASFENDVTAMVDSTTCKKKILF
ncbi:hypothetical protein TcasGA2_TC031876 [Tribolium castaneum]|uniref:Uncharacterized protein n=1 Tax=Tribolium castaneum TaxID=7070 RepID=A0A139W9S3_TRICA|nr:hypothetical protein TcasGA2_TC031876 [Tribolium castaneum]